MMTRQSILGISGAAPLISVIVPVRDAAGALDHCLSALRASTPPTGGWELIVVDDGSADDSAVVAARHADVVVRLGVTARGPAYARNRGAELARGELLVFVDADIRVRSDTLRRLAEALEEQPDVAAVIGTYDDQHRGAGIVSRYRDLLRHYMHQRSAGDVGSFWGGCGIIRRRAFVDAGAYDEWRFRGPGIEDIELGDRLRADGERIVLRSDIRVAHLKRWTLGGLLRTDTWSRGLLVARVLGVRRTIFRARLVTLATRWTRSEALVCAAAGLAAVAAAGGLLPAALAAGAAFLAATALNLPLYAFLARRTGVTFVVAIVPLHTLRQLLTGVAFVCGWALRHAIGEPRPDPVTEALAEVGMETWPPLPARR